MQEVGIRELKAHASEIVRGIREGGARYTITYRGRPVALMLPVPSPHSAAPDAQEVLEELDRLGKLIGEAWDSDLDSADLISSMRR
ncbi:MAG: prevent-host-death family protein [Chloroflexi bacterium]|nr:prevent-host-death family protein [Chloroflexota bacterium]